MEFVVDSRRYGIEGQHGHWVSLALLVTTILAKCKRSEDRSWLLLTVHVSLGTQLWYMQALEVVRGE